MEILLIFGLLFMVASEDKADLTIYEQCQLNEVYKRYGSSEQCRLEKLVAAQQVPPARERSFDWQQFGTSVGEGLKEAGGSKGMECVSKRDAFGYTRTSCK